MRVLFRGRECNFMVSRGIQATSVSHSVFVSLFLHLSTFLPLSVQAVCLQETRSSRKHCKIHVFMQEVGIRFLLFLRPYFVTMDYLFIIMMVFVWKLFLALLLFTTVHLWVQVCGESKEIPLRPSWDITFTRMGWTDEPKNMAPPATGSLIVQAISRTLSVGTSDFSAPITATRFLVYMVFKGSCYCRKPTVTAYLSI